MSYAGPTQRGKQVPLPRSSTQLASNAGAGAGTTSSSSGRRAFDPDLAERVSSRPRRRNWDNMTVFAAGIAVGLAVGVGTALLFAPQSGEEVRYSIARRARRLSRRGGDAWEDLRRELRGATKRRMRSLRNAVRRKTRATGASSDP